MGKKEKTDYNLSDIFKTLFRDAPQQECLSLFSNNPFRRKSETSSVGLDSNPQQRQAPVLYPAEDQDFLAEKKKRKKERERSPSLHENEFQKSSERKRKKIEVDDDIGTMMNIDENTGGETRRNKKKRKREEIEEVYEARIYGEIAERKDKEVALGVKVGEKRKMTDYAVGMDLVPSKEDFDDEGKLQRTVFVGNLPLKTKKKALLKEFSQFGEVESVRIRSVPLLHSKLPRKSAIFKGKVNDSIDSVHAYIVFKDEQSAQVALSHNMAKVGGNHIRVDRACPPRKKLKGETSSLYDNKRTVFVGNLPFDVKDEELYQLFCGTDAVASNVEAVRVIRDPNTSLGKGIAYVLFKTREAANLVVKKKDYKLRDRPLRLSHARKESMLAKRKNPELEPNILKKRRELMVSSETPSDKTGKVKAKAAPLPYQGLRASKSGDRPKKQVVFQQKNSDSGRSELLKVRAKELKASKAKRPAVAARKAKANALKAVGISKQTGKKRKPENSTPQSHGKKKARTSR